MIRLYKAFIMSLGMFTIIPVPHIWDEDSMPLVMPLFPVVGVIIGIIWYLLLVLLSNTGIDKLLQSAFIMLCPLFISGFLHMDGFIDTADAILSRRALEEKRRILKDPLVGAFGVIALFVYMLLFFCAAHTVAAVKPPNIIVLIPVLSRSIAGIALINLKPISETGFGALFKKNARPSHTIVLLIAVLICLVLAYAISGTYGAAVLVFSSFIAICSVYYTYKQLDGISGDLCGCAVTVCELAGVLWMALC